MAEWLEEGSEQQGRGDNSQGILLLQAKEVAQQGTEDEHEAGIEQGQDHRQGRIDERAANDDINLPQTGALDGDSNTEGKHQEREGEERPAYQLIGRVGSSEPRK